MVLPELQQMGLKIKAVAEALYGVQHYRVLYAVHCTDTTHTQVWLLAFCQLFSHAWIPVFAKRFLCSRRTSGFFYNMALRIFFPCPGSVVKTLAYKAEFFVLTLHSGFEVFASCEKV